MGDPQLGKSPRRLKKRGKVIILIVVAITAAILSDSFLNSFIGDYNSNPAWVGSFSGIDHHVYADSSELLDNFSLNTPSWLNGTFQSQGPVSFYALNQSEYSIFFSNGSLSSYLFSDIGKTSGTMNLSFPPEPVYFILSNPTNQTTLINFSFSVYRGS